MGPSRMTKTEKKKDTSLSALGWKQRKFVLENKESL